MSDDSVYKRAAQLALDLNGKDEKVVKKALGLEPKPLDTICPCGCGKTWADFLQEHPEYAEEGN